MLDVEGYIYSALSEDAALLALVGDITHITSSYPEEVTVFPSVIFRLAGQPDSEFGDNVPIGNNCTLEINIYVMEDDTFNIANAVYNIFYNLKWACNYNEELPDPDIRVRHRVMRFNRLLFAGDIV